MSSIFAGRIYNNEDTADIDIIQFFTKSHHPTTLRSTTMLHILLSDRPSLMPRPLRVVRPHNPEVEPFLRVFSWNILAQALGGVVEGFARTDRTLEWSERRFYYLQEITQYHPDVICLQEVDHYRFLEASLATTGYIGRFVKKPESPCLYVEGNNGPDGVAMFFDSTKFEWVSWKSRVIEVCGVPSNQVILGAILRIRANCIEVFVAVTHLKAKNSRLMAIIRDHQGKDILQWIEQEAEGRPVILCGDFNAEPTEEVYQRVRNHELSLKSAYCVNHEEPEYTTWKIRRGVEEKRTIDYIFHSDSLTVLQVLDLPRIENVAPERFPNESYPSDHLSLLADFDLNCRYRHREAEDVV